MESSEKKDLTTAYDPLLKADSTPHDYHNAGLESELTWSLNLKSSAGCQQQIIKACCTRQNSA